MTVGTPMVGGAVLGGSLVISVKHDEGVTRSSSVSQAWQGQGLSPRGLSGNQSARSVQFVSPRTPRDRTPVPVHVEQLSRPDRDENACSNTSHIREFAFKSEAREDKRVADFQEDLRRSRDAQERLQKDVAQLRADLADTATENDILVQKINSLNNLIKEKDSQVRLQSLQSRELSQKSKEVDRLQKECDLQRHDVQSLKDENKSLREENRILQEENKTLQAALTEAAHLRARLKHYENQSRSETEKRQKLDQDQKVLEEDIKRNDMVKRQMEKWQAKNTEDASHLEKQRRVLDQMKLAHDSAVKEHQVMKTQFGKEREKELENLQGQKRELEEERLQLKSRRHGEAIDDQRFAEMELHNKELQERVDALERECMDRRVNPRMSMDALRDALRERQLLEQIHSDADTRCMELQSEVIRLEQEIKMARAPGKMTPVALNVSGTM